MQLKNSSLTHNVLCFILLYVSALPFIDNVKWSIIFSFTGFKTCILNVCLKYLEIEKFVLQLLLLLKCLYLCMFRFSHPCFCIFCIYLLCGTGICKS